MPQQRLLRDVVSVGNAICVRGTHWGTGEPGEKSETWGNIVILALKIVKNGDFTIKNGEQLRFYHETW